MGRISHVFISWWHDETYSLNIYNYTGNHPRMAASFSYFQAGEIWYISQIIYIYRHNYTYMYTNLIALDPLGDFIEIAFFRNQRKKMGNAFNNHDLFRDPFPPEVGLWELPRTSILTLTEDFSHWVSRKFLGSLIKPGQQVTSSFNINPQDGHPE